MSTETRPTGELAREYWNRWNARDWEGLRALVSPNFVHHDERHDIGYDGYVEGSKGVLTQLGSEYRVTVEQVVDGGDEVAVRWTGRGRHEKTFLGETPSGRELIVHGMDFFTVEDGRMAENWQILDMTGLRKQVEAIRDEMAKSGDGSA